MVKLGEVCIAVDRKQTPIAGVQYRQLGVRLWGIGAYEREPIDGSETNYNQLNCVASNDLVVNKIWARNGSVAIVTPQLAGCFVSSEFPLYKLCGEIISPMWMRLITKWPNFWHCCDEKARGTSGKNRIKPAQFLAVQVPLPSLPEQQALVAQLEALEDKIQQVEAHLTAAEAEMERLLAVQFHEAIKDAPYKPMAEVAPLVRRQVTLDAALIYREIGARSFGKGLFFKPDFNGSSATWQKPVWIAAGDLVLSNIKAWEGAIGIAHQVHDGCIASHRYITCVPKPTTLTIDFLAYYLLSPEGIEQVNLASPGTADRNRTLGIGNLAKIKVPTPSIVAQQAFDCLQYRIAALKAEHATIRQATQALMPSMLEQLFSGAVQVPAQEVVTPYREDPQTFPWPGRERAILRLMQHIVKQTPGILESVAFEAAHLGTMPELCAELLGDTVPQFRKLLGATPLNDWHFDPSHGIRRKNIQDVLQKRHGVRIDATGCCAMDAKSIPYNLPGVEHVVPYLLRAQQVLQQYSQRYSNSKIRTENSQAVMSQWEEAKRRIVA